MSERITWHTAFYDAIRLEFIHYQDVLEFAIEHQLTREPLRIDMVIIKKKKDALIDKHIAAIFRGRNLVEFKGPDGSLRIADFNKVMAYAYLYCTPPESGAIDDVTITFVSSREPRELKNHLRDVYHYRLTEKWPGITVIEGGVMPMQIIERKKLPAGEARWLVSLGRGLSAAGITAVIDAAKRVPKGTPIGAYMYMLIKANDQKAWEVMNMADLAVIEKVFAGSGIIEHFRAQGKAIGEVTGKEQKAVETARIMKANNEPVSKIVMYTGLTKRRIAKL
jgi:hypothetical protein